MEPKKIVHFLYCPFTGLGLYNGFRGNRWLKNRIQIFKQFVVPSLLAQTSKNFVLWVSWRYEERTNRHVKEFKKFLDGIQEFKSVFTYSGICFYDDKYEDKVARSRLAEAVHGSLAELFEPIGITDYVLMTIQPSDDLYHKEMVEQIQGAFDRNSKLQALGFTKGYLANYRTLEIREYNPNTNPPFYTIKFPTPIFIEPFKHIDYTGIKHDRGKYKAGTPLPSHEYVGDVFGENYGLIGQRGFLVGTHGENISTYFNHPFGGQEVDKSILEDFGLRGVQPIKLKVSLRRVVMRNLPYGWQRRLRYWLGERFFAKIYEFLRS